jgi:NTE family protein
MDRKMEKKRKEMEKGEKTDRTKVGIACQGGGAQTAFTAGVLKTIFDNNIHHHYRIVGLTGTSGGALDAALGWYGMLKEAEGDKTPIGKRITDFWEDLMAQEPMEMFFDQTATDFLRKVSAGTIPSIEISPSNPWMQWMMSTIAKFMPRERFMNFRGLLEDHIEFNEIDSLLKPDSPVLLLGAANVMKGNLKIFSSYNGEISVEAILASACVPNIFPAVQIGDDYYWDGLFSANPPVDELVQTRLMGKGNTPDEIWIIMINPVTCKTVPTLSSEIVDRRNQMIGNVSVMQDLETLMTFERIIERGGLREEAWKEYGFKLDKNGKLTWVKIRFVHMSQEVQDTLDYTSKLSRHPDLIHKLTEEGERQGEKLLADLSKPAQTVVEALKGLGGIVERGKFE